MTTKYQDLDATRYALEKVIDRDKRALGILDHVIGQDMTDEFCDYTTEITAHVMKRTQTQEWEEQLFRRLTDTLNATGYIDDASFRLFDDKQELHKLKVVLHYNARKWMYEAQTLLDNEELSTQ